MAKEIRLEGFLRSGGDLTPACLVISQPKVIKEDVYCEIHAPGLLASETKVFGVDEEQARELSIGFVKRMLKDRQFVDAAGNLLEPI